MFIRTLLALLVLALPLSASARAPDDFALAWSPTLDALEATWTRSAQGSATVEVFHASQERFDAAIEVDDPLGGLLEWLRTGTDLSAHCVTPGRAIPFSLALQSDTLDHVHAVAACTVAKCRGDVERAYEDGACAVTLAPALSRWQGSFSSGLAGQRVVRLVNFSGGNTAYVATWRELGNPAARDVTQRFAMQANAVHFLTMPAGETHPNGALFVVRSEAPLRDLEVNKKLAGQWETLSGYRTGSVVSFLAD